MILNRSKIGKKHGSFRFTVISAVHLGSSNQRNGYYMQDDLTQTDTMIKSVESIRDLGIIADNKFKFDKHIAEIAKKASGVLASIKSKP